MNGYVDLRLNLGKVAIEGHLVVGEIELRVIRWLVKPAETGDGVEILVIHCRNNRGVQPRVDSGQLVPEILNVRSSCEELLHGNLNLLDVADQSIGALSYRLNPLPAGAALLQ